MTDNKETHKSENDRKYENEKFDTVKDENWVGMIKDHEI